MVPWNEENRYEKNEVQQENMNIMISRTIDEKIGCNIIDSHDLQLKRRPYGNHYNVNLHFSQYIKFTGTAKAYSSLVPKNVNLPHLSW